MTPSHSSDRVPHLHAQFHRALRWALATTAHSQPVILSAFPPPVILSAAKDLCILPGEPHHPKDHRAPHSLQPHRKDWVPLRRPRYETLRSLLISAILLAAGATQAQAQGCTQCLDSTRATPPHVQAAYRHAILLLGGAGATLFIAGALLLRKEH